MFYRKRSTILLTLWLVLSLMPVTARADNESIIVSAGEHLEEVPHVHEYHVKLKWGL